MGLDAHKNFKSISIKVNPEYYRRLSEYSQKNEIPIRQMILQSLDQYMKAHPVKSES